MTTKPPTHDGMLAKVSCPHCGASDAQLRAVYTQQMTVRTLIAFPTTLGPTPVDDLVTRPAFTKAVFKDRADLGQSAPVFKGVLCMGCDNEFEQAHITFMTKADEKHYKVRGTTGLKFESAVRAIKMVQKLHPCCDGKPRGGIEMLRIQLLKMSEPATDRRQDDNGPEQTGVVVPNTFFTKLNHIERLARKDSDKATDLLNDLLNEISSHIKDQQEKAAHVRNRVTEPFHILGG